MGLPIVKPNKIQGWLTYILQVVVIVIVYVLTGIISGKILSPDPYLPIIWIPSGISLAIIVLGGYRYIAGVALGVICIGLLSDYNIVVLSIIAIFNSFSLVFGTYLLNTVWKIDTQLKRVQDVLILIHIGAFVTMFLGSILVTLTIAIFLNYSSAQAIQQFMTLWIGSSLSVIFITPLILVWVDSPIIEQSWQIRLEVIGLITFTIVLGWMSYSNVLQLQTATPIFYMMLPPIVWAMIRFRLREVTLVNAIMIGMMLWGVYSPQSLFADMTYDNRLLFIWSSIAIGSVLSLLVKVLIDERRLMEKALRVEHDRTVQILEALGQGISVVSKEGKFEYVNPAFANLLEMDAEDMIGLSPYEIIADSFKPELETVFKMRQDGQSSSYQATLKSSRGEEITVLTTGVARYRGGEYDGTISVMTDMRPILEAEQAIIQSEAMFRAVFENSADAIAVIDRSGKVMMSNSAHRNLVGYTADELRQMRAMEYVHPDDAERGIKLFQESAASGQDSYEHEWRFVHRDKSIRWIHDAVGLVRDNDGNVQYTIAINRDITESRHAKIAIENSEKRFRAIFENTSVPITVTRDDHTISMVNPAFSNMVGYSVAELQNVKFDDITYPSDNDENTLKLQQLINNEIDQFTLTKRYVHRDGSIIWANLSVSRFIGSIEEEYPMKPYVIAVAENITERLRVEHALKESEEQYRSIFENSLIGIYRSTMDGRFLRVNPTLVNMLGYDTAQELYELEIARDLFANPSERMSTEQIKDYEETNVINTHPLLKKKNGEIIRVNVRTKIVRDENHKILYFEGSMIDITEQHRQAEEIKQLNDDLEQRVKERTEQLELANEQLVDLDRLRTKFIADMSHEMRTPLAVLNTRLYLLQHSKNQDSLERHIEGFRIQIDRLEEFVENAFDISVIDMSRDNIKSEKISLNNIIEHVVSELLPRAEVNELSLNHELDPNLPHIMGVETHLSQVVTNLVSNAIKYTEAGQVKVTTGIEPSTDHVLLKVTDTGMGIPDDDISHLFSRFYRGQQAGQSTIPGSGLGLSIVKEIVDAHGGQIDVMSELNVGTVVTVWLPIDTDQTHDDIATRDE